MAFTQTYALMTPCKHGFVDASSEKAVSSALLTIRHAGALAAKPKQVPHPKTLLTHIPSSLPGLEVYHTFPEFSHPQQVEAGQDVPVLLTVRNGYNATVLISYGAGTLASPLAPGVALDYLQVEPFQKTVKADAEASFEYRYKLHERMPHRDFNIALTLFYNDLSSFLGHATTYFNQTVEVVEARKMVDTEALGIIATIAAVSAFIGVLPGFCLRSICQLSCLTMGTILSDHDCSALRMLHE